MTPPAGKEVCGSGNKKRSMLLVWENATPDMPQRFERGELKPDPVEFS
jgi:hypothetical protein